MLSFYCSGLFSLAFIKVDTILPYLRNKFINVSLYSTITLKTKVIIFLSVNSLIENRHLIKNNHIVVVSDSLFNLEKLKDSVIIDFKNNKVLKKLISIEEKPVKLYEIDNKLDILTSIINDNKGSDFQAAYIKAISSIGEEGKNFINRVIYDFINTNISLEKAIDKLSSKLQGTSDLVSSKLIYEFSNNIENYKKAIENNFTEKDLKSINIDPFLLEFFRKLK